jgi:hypothetical protein
VRTPDCCAVKPLGSTGKHSFARFWLGRGGKFWNPLIVVGQIGSWYVGHECVDCGEPGYAI